MGARGSYWITAAMLCVGLALLAGHPANAEISWRAGALTDAAHTQVSVQQALAELAARPDKRHVIVEFDQPVTPVERAQLDDAGLVLLNYLGENGFFAALRPDYAAGAVAAVTSLRMAQGIAREHKLAPEILENAYPDYAVGVDPVTGEELVAAYVLFHGDVSLYDDGVTIAEQHGALVVSEIASVNGLVIEFPRANLDALADEDAVMWIEPPLPFMTVTNNSNRTRVQASAVQSAPYNLDGSGVTVLIYDGGTARASHVDFGGRLTVHDSSGTHYHSTHVAGTVGGSGAASGGTYAGMAPGVTMLAYGFQYDGSGIFLYSNPGDLVLDSGQLWCDIGVDRRDCWRKPRRSFPHRLVRRQRATGQPLRRGRLWRLLQHGSSLGREKPHLRRSHQLEQRHHDQLQQLGTGRRRTPQTRYRGPRLPEQRRLRRHLVLLLERHLVCHAVWYVDGRANGDGLPGPRA
jgi:hypothetical protein